jgi:hypothetical protein
MAPALPIAKAETSVGRRFLGSSQASILPASTCVSVVPRSKHNRGQKIRVQHLSAVRSRGNEVLLNGKFEMDGKVDISYGQATQTTWLAKIPDAALRARRSDHYYE